MAGIVALGAAAVAALFVIAALGIESGGPVTPQQWASYSANRTPRWSADGQAITVNLRYSIYRVSADGIRMERLPAQGEVGQFSPSLSTEGRIAYLDSKGRVGRITTMDRDGKRIKRHLKIRGEHKAGIPQWSPHGQHIAVARISQSIIMTEDGEIVATHNNPFPSGAIPTWSNNGEKVAFAWCFNGPRCGITIASLDDASKTVLDIQGIAKPDAIQDEAVMNLSSVVWSPDDQTIYYIVLRGLHLPAVLHALNLSTLESRFVAELGGQWVDHIHLSPDDDTLLCIATKIHNGELVYDQRIYLININGTAQREITPDGLVLESRIIAKASWSPDGSRIAVSHNGYWPALFTIAPDGSDLRALIVRDAEYNHIPAQAAPAPP